MRFAIFASGSGSNAARILQAVQSGDLEGVPQFVFSDRKGAGVLFKAEQYNVTAYQFSPKEYESKEEYEEALLKLLKEHRVEWVVLAGYMRLIGDVLLRHYEGRMVNIHPSLLPSYPGLDAIGQAIDDGATKSGVTIHYVDRGMDTGPIIAQQSLSIERGETKEQLTTRIQQLEHQLYPKTLQRVFKEGEAYQ
ncbi:phosphoribosylglycinamide formyltransferase [Geomicrobium sp. JCM 19038]|uniref:phosphoribosylglycinamide formyltransferase n=1 Tax=Geomicrobium sp. JCM 19038 TaxID=1460635 RepID=UPI00045F32DF|nr:phosphoribosylglycinamide formyltransferase [Geomicrobium sp. JCM 19038]GAK08880.1 phosphoribosylglycinamide formyltransferase [Geomicrobium sp. JCM 19038]